MDISGSGRRAGVAIGIVLAVVFSVLAVPARYIHHTLFDTDRYVEMMAPLADDPAVQTALTDALTARVMEQLAVDELIADLATSLADRPIVPDRVENLAPVLTNQIESLIERNARRLVTSPDFAAVWADANRLGHAAVVDALDGSNQGVFDVSEEGVVSVPLAPFLDGVRDVLAERGFAALENVDVGDRSVVLLDSPIVARAQWVVRLLNRLAVVLPIAVLVAIAAAAGLAQRRRRAVAIAAGAIGVTMIALTLVVNTVRNRVVDAIPSSSNAAAGKAVAEALTAPLLSVAQRWAAIALVLAVAMVGWKWWGQRHVEPLVDGDTRFVE